MNTDARRRAAKNYRDKIAKQGVKPTTVRLSAQARAALDRLKAVFGSKDAAAEAAILKLDEESEP